MEILIGVVTLVLGVVTPIWLHRLSHPQRELRYHMDTPATASPGLDAKYPLYVTLWSSSRADIPSATFDASRPLRFDLGTSIFPDSFASDPISNTPRDAAFAQWTPTGFELRPTLLPRTALITARMYVQSAPSVTVLSPLIDVAVVHDSRRPTPAVLSKSRRKSRITAIQVVWGVTLTSILMLAISIGINVADETSGIALGAPSLFILMIAVPVLLALYVIRWVKAASGRKRDGR